jgi:hypothetical protein
MGQITKSITEKHYFSKSRGICPHWTTLDPPLIETRIFTWTVFKLHYMMQRGGRYKFACVGVILNNFSSFWFYPT